VDYRPDFQHYAVAITRGIEAFMDTTFLSAVATPIAGVTGVVIAYLVVRKAFRGKETLDFLSNLGGAVPGTILGIGYILAFIEAPVIVVGATGRPQNSQAAIGISIPSGMSIGSTSSRYGYNRWVSCSML
jgi:ABC-type Fe3+ transport system permease subunit